MPAGKDERIKLNVAAISKNTKGLFPSISGSQSARNPGRHADGGLHLPTDDATGQRTSRSGGSSRPGRTVGVLQPSSGVKGGTKVDGLTSLEQRWRQRQAPKNKEELKSQEETKVKNQQELAVQRASAEADGTASAELASLTQINARTSESGSRPRTAAMSDTAEKDAEMAQLQALMAGNDVDAAEAKLEEIIRAAVEDGEVDEEEQKQIEAAQRELEQMKAKKEEKDRQLKEAEERAGEHAALQALLAVNDVAAAEEKLRSIIAAAEADGEVDEAEQAEIDAAGRDVAKMKERQEQLRKHEAEKAQRQQGGKLNSPLGRVREEKVMISIAAKETAAERLRLATELRELKDKFLKLSNANHRALEEKKQVEEALALLTVEMQGAKSSCQRLADTLADKERELEEVREGKAAAEAELERTRRLAETRKKQLQELNTAFEQARLRWDKDLEILGVKEQRAAQLATELQQKVSAADSAAEQLARDNRQLAETTNLEKQSAQLERATCDKYRVRCVDMEEKWSEAVQQREQLLLESQRLSAELNDTLKHLEEAGMWHRARVNARRTTRDLLTLPPETQEIQMPSCGLVDDDGVMVAEFLINNLMIVTCDISNNDIGATALVSNRVLSSLNLKDNPIGAQGCEKLATMLMGNRTLEKLNLMGCNVGDAGCLALCSALRQDKCTLQMLALRFNEVTDVGAEAMARVLEVNSSLTELGLNNNKITDDGVATISVALARNNTLSLLRLTENPLGRESLKRLTNAQRPGLHLYF